MSQAAYLDYAASTPLDPQTAALINDSALGLGNASATHSFGRAARELVDAARAQVADFLGGRASEVTFTSGATEANNLAVLGWWRALRPRLAGRTARIVASRLEHSSVLASLSVLEEEGAVVDWAPVGRDAVLDAAAAEGLVGPDTVLVTCPLVSNVFGTVQPVGELAAAVRAERGRRGAGGLPILFHADAVQAARFFPFVPEDLGVDAMSLSAHKLYGPKGIGALWVRRGVELTPLLVGGGQESGRRSGTENVAGIVGFGESCRLLAARLGEERRHAAFLRARLLEGLVERGLPWTPVGDGKRAVEGIVALVSPRHCGDEAALKLDFAGFAVSSGSACDSGKRTPPAAAAEVLGEQAARRGVLRVSWGRGTTEPEIDGLLAALSRL